MSFIDDIEVCELVDKHEVWENILFQYCDMEVLDNDSKWFRKHVIAFFKHQNPIIHKLAYTTQVDYDPLTDYTRQLKRGTEKAKKGKEDRELSRQVNEQTTTTMNTEELFNVSAFNDATPGAYKNRNQTITDSDGAGTDDTTTKQNIGIKNVETSAEGVKENEIGNNKYTFQELLQQERRVATYDVLDYILEQFAKELLVAVW